MSYLSFHILDTFSFFVIYWHENCTAGLKMSPINLLKYKEGTLADKNGVIDTRTLI